MILHLVKDDTQVLRMYVLGLRSSWGTLQYILHGPLLAIYWLPLCPHSVGRPLEATLAQRMLFIVLMTATHISPTSFPSEHFTPMYRNILLKYSHGTHSYCTSHSYIYSHSYYTSQFVHLHLHFFCFLWQTGCLRLFVSDTFSGQCSTQFCSFALTVSEPTVQYYTFFSCCRANHVQCWTWTIHPYVYSVYEPYHEHSTICYSDFNNLIMPNLWFLS